MDPAADKPPSVVLTARQRARAAVTSEILQAARDQLAVEGAAALSLRAVARSLGMPSSGIYRYFATRDELLTRLIVEAYDSVGEATEGSQAGLKTADVGVRFAAACRAVRTWALAHPHEYALIFGSPVPSYEAPAETVAAANRIPAVLGGLLLESEERRRRGRRRAADRIGPPLSPEGAEAIEPASQLFDGRIPPERLQVGLMVWMSLLGVISFELFGHMYGAVGPSGPERDAYFESCVAIWTDQVLVG
jgi:AcrR family transcriptional regulator